MISRALREAVALLALAALPALISGFVQLKWQAAPPPLLAGEVRLATVQMWGDAVQWVDARSSAKFAQQQIPGAVLLNNDQWEELVPAFLDAWDPEKTIVVYGDARSDDDAHAVAERLRQELKLESVWVLKGGWPAWLQK